MVFLLNLLIKIKFFFEGKIVITGCKGVGQIYKSFESIYLVLKLFIKSPRQKLLTCI
jgi:TATA-box binding protein (TBP) (component of TFIID and TFIIIB)